ncbi:MAG: insulinase family protein [Tenericutes bacterium]|nr:insulinase family protein [Mycoplasmatota bacterium]
MKEPIKRTINGIDVYYIKSKKFKTITCSMVFTHEQGIDLINEYYFLSNALVDNMKKYPSNVLKYRYQSSLYGLDAFGSATSIGNNIVNHFVITYPNELYLEQEPDLSKKAFIFLNEIITNPSLRKGKFTKKVLNDNVKEAKELHELLKSVKDMYAYYNFTKLFYKDKLDLQFNFPENDRLSDVTLDTFTNAYNDMFNKDSVSIFVTGDIDENKFDEIIKETLSPRIVNHQVKSIDRNFSYNKDAKPKIKKEYDNVSQSRIFIGYTTNIKYFTRDHAALSIMNNIFGGFDQSKLFIEIREKHNLSYYVDSNYQPEENLVTVSLSTSKANEDIVIQKVTEILDEIKAGEFSDDLFKQAKENCMNSLESLVDSQSRYLLQHIKSYHLTGEKYDLQHRISLYRSITQEDVVKAANSLVLDTVYLYTKRGDLDA